MLVRSSQFHRCTLCDTVVEVLEQCGVELVCCGRPMVAVHAKACGRGRDGHMPFVETTDRGLKVSVSREAHPMDPDHHILWIELVADGKYDRQFLRAGQPAEATFDTRAGNFVARTYCSVHGLWSSEPLKGPADAGGNPAGSSVLSCA